MNSLFILLTFFKVVLGGATLYEPDGRCTKANGYACDQAGPCCSKWGYCGATAAHCAPSNCIANCWETEEEPPIGWQFTPSPLIKNYLEKNNDEGESGSSEELTASELGIFRQINHFPDEYLGVYVKCIEPNTMALTYDDGPSDLTPKLLDLLDKEGIKATFFALARNLDSTITPEWKANQQTLRDIVKRGHRIGSHSFNHPNFIKVGVWETERDMKRAEEMFRKVLGFVPRMMRPPEGAINAEIAAKLHEMGYFIIKWSHDSNDWQYARQRPERTLQYVREKISKVGEAGSTLDSSIFLQHDTYPGTMKVQPEMIKILKEKGYKFVTVDECIGLDKPYRT